MENRRTGKPGSTFYIKKKAAYRADWVSEWDRVRTNRKHGLCKGGHYREWSREDDPLFVEARERYERERK